MSPMTIVTVLALASASVATTLHPNVGCIDVNGSGVCAGSSISLDGGSAQIAARFDSGNKFQTAVPGCILNANWPTFYQDIYYGEDNCLYDANGQNINGQCCLPGSGGTQQISNPYA